MIIELQEKIDELWWDYLSGKDKRTTKNSTYIKSIRLILDYLYQYPEYKMDILLIMRNEMTFENKCYNKIYT